jgi:hypothetical protein
LKLSYVVYAGTQFSICTSDMFLLHRIKALCMCQLLLYNKQILSANYLGKTSSIPISYKIQRGRNPLDFGGAIRKRRQKRHGVKRLHSPHQHRTTTRTPTHGAPHHRHGVAPLPGRLLPPPVPRFKIKPRNLFLCLAGAAVSSSRPLAAPVSPKQVPVTTASRLSLSPLRRVANPPRPSGFSAISFSLSKPSGP